MYIYTPIKERLEINKYTKQTKISTNKQETSYKPTEK